MRRASIVLSAALLLATTGAAHSDIGPVGPELPVSTDPTLVHVSPSIAADASGGFVVVWRSYAYDYGDADGSRSGVFGRRFDANGLPLGSSFQVNTYTPGPQTDPSVARAPTGEFVVTWTSGGYSDQGRAEPDGSATGVFLQRFDRNGIRLGLEQQVNTFTGDSQFQPDVSIDPAGNFVVVWSSGTYYGSQDGDRSGIFGQRFGATGSRLGAEFQVNTVTTDFQLAPAVASMPSGAFVVVWESGDYGFDADGDRRGVFGQRFDANGVRAGSEFQVNSFTPGNQYYADVAARPDGGFVVVWQNTDYASPRDGDGASVTARLFGPNGAPLGDDFVVNAFTTGYQAGARVATDPDGNFVVTWESGGYYGPDGSSRAIRAQHFSSTGAPIGDEVQVNTYTTGAQNDPAIAADGHGGFVIGWSDYGGGAAFDLGAVYAQRFRTTAFTPPIPLAGTTLSLKDGPNPAKRKLVVTSRDSDVDIGGHAGSIDDPTVHGATLRIRGATFDQTFTLPAANWRAVGPGLGYEYRDGKRLAGPIVRVRVRAAQVLDVRGQGAGLGYSLASNPRPVSLAIQLGAVGQRSCSVFSDGTYSFRPGRSFKAKNASSPTACPQ
jgi:hypothetical protein